jgi:hypothetical protein
MPVAETLQEGQTVEFQVVKGPKGWQAEDVRSVPEAEAAKGYCVSSGITTIPRSGQNCTEYTCSPNGCAMCAKLSVSIPANALVKGWHCMTTMKSSILHEVPCGGDGVRELQEWELFDHPTQNATGQHCGRDNLPQP